MSWGTRDLTVRYGARRALDGVTLAAPAGAVTGVVGGDGAGKSTLLRCLAGAERAAAGTVRRPARTRIGYLAPGSGTYPDLSVAENLAFCARAYGVSPAEGRRRVDDLLGRTGLAPFRERLAGDLSGGMRQKLGVVQALVHRPDLVVLDEPTTGIDPVSRADLWWLLARAAAGGAAVVFSTTYLDEAERAAQVLVLHEGRSLAAGTPADILGSVPGSIEARTAPPRGAEAGRAWRRGGRWHVWRPDAGAGTGRAPATPDGPTVVEPDLHDAVIALALADERPAATGSGAGDAVGSGAGDAAGDGVRGGAGDAAGGCAGSGGRVSAPLARASAATRRFGRFVAVDGVDLEVGRGEVVGLLGANGAGKTTLIRMLLGLLRPTAGAVRMFGAPPSRATRRRLGYVPQGLGLYTDLTASENLAFARAVFGDGAGPEAVPAGGGPRAGQPVGRLPLGVQRRVAFAQALDHRPDLLVLDEPTSGVDPLARARLWQTIQEVAAAGAGVLVTTHAMQEAEECDRLVMLAAGRVVAEGTVAGIVGGHRVTAVETGRWARAFDALERGGLTVALVGRSLRVPGADPATVRRVLGDLAADVREVPATLEERFFALVTA